jgi:hypothetical protein
MEVVMLLPDEIVIAALNLPAATVTKVHKADCHV